MTHISSQPSLKDRFVGKTLYEVPTPSIVLDLAKLEVNCQRMIDTAAKNGIGWRAHIKTHKTTELTKLQVGSDVSTPANIIVSTLLEAENIAPLLLSYQQQCRPTNILYAFPLYPSALPRLASLATTLGPNSLSLLLDHPSQVSLLTTLQTLIPNPQIKPLIFLKINVATNRAGVLPSTPTYTALLAEILAAEKRGHCVLHGLYAHAGHSYSSRGDWAALAYLTTEFRTLQRVARDVRALSPGHRLTLSVGATPTATALQHPELPSSSPKDAAVASLAAVLAELKADDGGEGLELEVHAGVYPTLDLQQLATHARDSTLLGSGDIAVSVVAEVASLYEGRGKDGRTEALINAGSLALGREPVKIAGDEEDGYAGWGVVMPWGEGLLTALEPAPRAFPVEHGGWQVGRISQEHGILVWMGKKEEEAELKFGQRVRVWPNHSCIAGAGYGHYLVVDGRRVGKEDEVVDVWERWNGW